MRIPNSLTPFPEDPPSRDEIILTEALRRRATVIAERCLPAIIREAGYEELVELHDLFWWFGSPEAILLENPEGHFGTPGLTLEEANVHVLFRMMRGDCYVPPGCAGPEAAPSPGAPPSREEVIVMQAFRRRATAMAERCLPAIIREAIYEELEELIAVFRWFGSPEAMQLEYPEDYVRVPGLSLEEASALVRLRIERREFFAAYGVAGPATPPPAPAVAEPAAPAPPAPRLVERAGPATPAPAQALVEPPVAAFAEKALVPFSELRSAAPAEPSGAATPAKAELPPPQTPYRVFRKGKMWFLDPKTKKIAGEAPP